MECPKCGKDMTFVRKSTEMLATVWECEDCEITVVRPEEDV